MKRKLIIQIFRANLTPLRNLSEDRKTFLAITAFKLKVLDTYDYLRRYHESPVDSR